MVFEPTITCPIEFDFTVSLSTFDGSAGTYTCTSSYSTNVYPHKFCDYYDNFFKFIDNYYGFLHKLAKINYPHKLLSYTANKISR